MIILYVIIFHEKQTVAVEKLQNLPFIRQRHITKKHEFQRPMMSFPDYWKWVKERSRIKKRYLQDMSQLDLKTELIKCSHSLTEIIDRKLSDWLAALLNPQVTYEKNNIIGKGI